MTSLPEYPPVPRPVLGSPGVYDVPSASRPGTVHRVDANAPGCCTCESFTYHGHCKHLDLCRYAEGNVARQRALCRPRPTVLSLAETAPACCQCGSNVVMLGTQYCAFCAPGVMQYAAVSQ